MKGLWFQCLPDGAAWIVRAMIRAQMRPAAVDSDPWGAAARCARYMVFRASPEYQKSKAKRGRA